MKKVVILQSNYIPWKGYFDLIHDADLFVFYDDVQYTTRDWRNRNRIKTSDGVKWLSVPVNAQRSSLVNEVGISERKWSKQHWETIRHFYSKAPFFKQYRDFFADIYLNNDFTFLSDLNQSIIQRISRDILGITTIFQDSRIYNAGGAKTDRLLDILQKADADIYISGPAARSYIEEDKFKAAGVELTYKEYSGYPDYPQLYDGFDHYVTILDLIFNVGEETPYYIWGWRKNIV